jgi:hypothetical protein
MIPFLLRQIQWIPYSSCNKPTSKKHKKKNAIDPTIKKHKIKRTHFFNPKTKGTQLFKIL